MRKIASGLLLLTGFSSIFATFSAYAIQEPIEVTASPTYPISVNTSATTVVTYTLKDYVNNPKHPGIVIYPQLLTTTTTTAGSITETGGTCATGVTYNNTCTIQLTYTAPATVPSTNLATASIVFGYDGRNNILAQTGTFTIAAAPTGGITVSASPTYPQTVPVSTTVNVTYTIHSTASGTITPQLITGSTTVTAGSIAESGGTCSSGVAQGNDCSIQLTYTAPASVPTPNPATASIVFGYTGGSNTSAQAGTFTIVLPPTITSLSVTSGSVYGGQSVTITGTSLTALLAKSKLVVDSNAPQSQLGTTPTVTFDGQTAIIVGTPTSTSIVVTTPSDATNYVAPGGSPPSGGAVQPGASSGSTGGNGHSVNVVVTTSGGTASTTYTYVGLGDNYDGGIIFCLNPGGDCVTGNTPTSGGKVVNNSDGSNNINWTTANNNCTGMGSGWGLPDPYANGGSPTTGGFGVPLTGDFIPLYNSNSPSPYAGMSTDNAYWGLSDTGTSGNAWIASFYNGFESSFVKTTADSVLYARCVRAFSE